MPAVFAIARGVAIAGVEANRTDRATAVTHAAAMVRHGTAGPTLGASATLAVIARTRGQSRRTCVAPGDDPSANSHGPRGRRGTSIGRVPHSMRRNAAHNFSLHVPTTPNG